MDQVTNEPVRKNYSISRREFLLEVATVGGVSLFGDLLAKKLIFGDTEVSNPLTNVYEPHKPVIDPEGRRLELVSVLHNHRNLLENYDDITRRVKDSGIVFLEYFHQADRVYASPDLDPFLLTPTTNSESTQMFFGGIGHLCAKYGRDIAVVNPETQIVQEMDFYQLFGLPGAAAMEWLIPNRSKLTRREFLRWTTTLAAGLAWFSATGVTNQIRSGLEKFGILTSDLPESEQAKIISYGIVDWRDARTAYGIWQLLQINPTHIDSGVSMPMFQGGAHSGVIEYLKRPDRMHAKLALYGVHNALGSKDAVRVFTYDTQHNSWKIKARLPY